MKKILSVFAFLFFITGTIYSQELEKGQESVIENRIGEPTFLTGIEINMRNISYPYEVLVGIPSGRVLNVSGPTNNNMEWSMEANSMITIYFDEWDLAILEPNVIAYIEIVTTEARYYIEVRGVF